MRTTGATCCASLRVVNAEIALDPAIAGKLQSGPADPLIAQLAGQQHGVVARRQLLRLGLSGSAIDHRTDRGRLHVVHRGVYSVGHRLLGKEGKWMAAVLACGRGAVLSHGSAAALWGIRSANLEQPTDVTTPRACHSRSRLRRHVSRLPGDETTVERGIPVTTVPRTIFDLAAEEPMHQVESALRQSEYLRIHDRLSLPDLLARYPGRRGTHAVKAALARRAERPGRSRSWLEERFLPFIDRHHLPRPQLNAWLRIPGRTVQVDCLWPESKNVAELDGWAGHGTRIAFREDRARDRRLRVAGYVVTRISWAQLDDEPEAIAADLRVLLEERPAIQTSVITYSDDGLRGDLQPG